MNPAHQKTWGMLCLGWAVGLSGAWAVLNWLPFPELGFDNPLIIPVAVTVAFLLALTWVLDAPTGRMARGLTLGFGIVLAASFASMLYEITSFWFSAAALSGLLAYWHRLDRLAQTDGTRLLRAKHAMAWLLFAVALEGTLLLVMIVFATLRGLDALAMISVVGTLWLPLSLFAALPGHQFHEGVTLNKAKAPILWVFFLPWSLCVVAFVFQVATEHQSKTAVWGMVAGMAVAGWTAFHNRRLILEAVMCCAQGQGTRLP